MDPVEFQARWKTERLTLAEVEAAAQAWLAAGHAGPGIQELAASKDATREIHPLIEKALGELGQAPMSEVAARLWLSRQVARRMVAGAVAPLAGAEEIYWELWPFELREVLPPAIARLHALMLEALAAADGDVVPAELETRLRAEAAALLTIAAD